MQEAYCGASAFAMTCDELKSKFPNASATFLARNSDSGDAGIQPGSSRQAPVLEQHSGDGGMGAVQVEGRLGKRLLVRVTATRTRLLDEDNLCEKYHVDLLRYASGGALGDSPATTHIEVAQQKAGPGEPEEVRLEVFEL